MGWVAGGGRALEPQILAVAFFFFIWQVPHFWLLLLFSCGREYEESGLPSLTRVFSLEQIARITFVWIFATAVTCVTIPLFGIVSNAWVGIGLCAGGLWLVWRSVRILEVPYGMPAFRLAFKGINTYVLWVIVLLSVNGFIA